MPDGLVGYPLAVETWPTSLAPTAAAPAARTLDPHAGAARGSDVGATEGVRGTSAPGGALPGSHEAPFGVEVAHDAAAARALPDPGWRRRGRSRSERLPVSDRCRYCSVRPDDRGGVCETCYRDLLGGQNAA